MRRYELTNSEWKIISKYLPEKEAGTPGRPPNADRPLVNGIIWIARSGAPWRDMPDRYGAWQTVYTRFRELINNGVLVQIFRDLNIGADMQDISMDSTTVRAHQHSAGAKKRDPRPKSDVSAAD